MAYGILKCDTITFTDAGVDKSVTISGLVQNPTFSGNITVTGTVSGNTIQGQTVSGVTVTGTTSNFASGVFTTQISGATVTGNVGSFSTITGGTVTLTSGVFGAGSAAAPSIAFTGDLNTGIYSPGADQVAISTAGSGRLFVDASGNINIGSSFAGFGNGSGVEIQRSITATLRLTGNSGVGCEFYNTGSLASIQTRSAIPFTIQTNEQERLRITSAGLVGVGTSLPTQALSIGGSGGTLAGTAAISLFDSNSNGSRRWSISNGAGGNTVDLIGKLVFSYGNGSSSADPMSGIAAAVIDSSGRVGVGTTSPQNPLVVSNAGAEGLEIVPTGGSPNVIAFNRSTAAYAPLTLNGSVHILQTSGTERLRIDSSGNVGIGTSSPGEKLHVAGDGVRIDRSGGDPYIDFYTSGSANNVALYGGASTGFRVFVGGFERTRVDSSGRLLVGTSSARASGLGSGISLLVEGAPDTINIGTVRNSNNASSAKFVLAKTRGSAVGSNTAVQSDDSLGMLEFDGADGTQLLCGAAIESFVDGTPGANDMPGRLVFSTTADGASSPTERMRITKEGYVLIGATSFGSAGTSFTSLGGQVSYNNNSADTGVSLWLLSARVADTGRQFLYFQADAAGTPTLVFQVFNNGNTQNANNSYTSISDSRLKENIVDSNSQWNDIKAIKIRNWNFKAETGLETHRQIGPVAQELELVCPGLVFETFDRDSDGNNLETATKGVNQSVLYMKAVKALQEAMERIETLEAKVAALEGN